MKDQIRRPEDIRASALYSEPAGVLQRALYHWEQQQPDLNLGRSEAFRDINASDEQQAEPDDSPDADQNDVSSSADSRIEDKLQHYARRLVGVERVIPGDKRLDSPRFSLMMMNAFLGRATADGQTSAQLPGLVTICERIDHELSELEFEYPAALEQTFNDPAVDTFHMRTEMHALFSDFRSTQKAQQRQIISSLSALHAAIAELRTDLSDRNRPMAELEPLTAKEPQIGMTEPRSLADRLLDPEKLVDPRPVLAAARAAAARIEEPAFSPMCEELPTVPVDPVQSERPYRTLIFGTAILGLLMIFFGREAAQLFTSGAAPLGATAHP